MLYRYSFRLKFHAMIRTSGWWKVWQRQLGTHKMRLRYSTVYGHLITLSTLSSHYKLIWINRMPSISSKSLKIDLYVSNVIIHATASHIYCEHTKCTARFCECDANWLTLININDSDKSRDNVNKHVWKERIYKAISCVETYFHTSFSIDRVVKAQSKMYEDDLLL